MAEAQKQPKDFWDKLSMLSGVLAAVLVPGAIALVGQIYSSAIKEREIRISEQAANREWVQLGLDILRDPNTKENLRGWGVKIVSQYGGIKIEDEVKNALTSGKETLPPSQPLPEDYYRPSFWDVSLSVSQAKEALADLGFYNGPIDDMVDGDFKKAVQEFQRQNGLVADGMLGRTTWQAMKSKLADRANAKASSGIPAEEQSP